MVKKAKNVFIVLFHSYVTKGDENQVVERCEFVDSLKRKHLDSSTVIIDYLNDKILKNRSGDGDLESFVEYLFENYPEQMKELQSEYKPATIDDNDQL